MKSAKILLVIISAVVLFAGCKKDEDKTNKDMLVGKTWINTALTIDPPLQIGDITITDLFNQAFYACSKDDTQQFKSDGGYVFDEGASKCDPNDPQTVTGTWVMNPDMTVVTVTAFGETMSYTIVSISDNQLKYTYSITEDGITYVFTGTAKPV